MAPSVDALVVSVSFISNTGKVLDVEDLACVGRVLSLFAVLEDGFWEVLEALLLELWSTGCVQIKPQLYKHNTLLNMRLQIKAILQAQLY